MSALDKARIAWGESTPDWILVLSQACDDASQAKIARRIGWSAAALSNVLANRYPGDVAAVEQSVRAVLMAEEVSCPELGAMPLEACLEWRKKAENYAPTSGWRGRMFDACRACPLNDGKGGRS